MAKKEKRKSFEKEKGTEKCACEKLGLENTTGVRFCSTDNAQQEKFPPTQAKENCSGKVRENVSKVSMTTRERIFSHFFLSRWRRDAMSFLLWRLPSVAGYSASHERQKKEGENKRTLMDSDMLAH